MIIISPSFFHSIRKQPLQVLPKPSHILSSAQAGKMEVGSLLFSLTKLMSLTSTSPYPCSNSTIRSVSSSFSPQHSLHHPTTMPHQKQTKVKDSFNNKRQREPIAIIKRRPTVLASHCIRKMF